MKIKILGGLAMAFSLFLFAGTVLAAPAEALQPAADVTYNENLVVNATGIFDSIKVGKQGAGGVTFFNGTIVNETTGSLGEPMPVTFGDDMRIDGEIWRGPAKGTADNMPLKISDTMIPSITGINDLGSNTNKWKDIYVSGEVDGVDVSTENALWYSTDSDSISIVTVPGTNPKPSRTIVGGVDMEACTLAGQALGKNIDLPADFFSSSKSYVVNALEIDTVTRVFNQIYVKRLDNDEFFVYGVCLTNSGQGDIAWTATGY